MADDADRPDPGERGAGEQPEDASWPPRSGSPDPNGPAAPDQPTPQQPSGPWGEATGPWERSAGQPEESTAPWQAGGPTDGFIGAIGGGEAQDPWFGEDETMIHPAAAEETSALPPLDPNATSVIPPASGDNDPTRRWAARAGVPPAGSRPPQQQEWVGVEETRGGAWWMPILVSIIILILLALLGLGLWLGFRGHGSPAPAPSPSSTTTASSPSPAPSPTPSPTPSASPTPATVTMPSLHGVAFEEAQQVLTGLGLTVQVQNAPDDTLPPGTVSRTQPDAGAQVPVGSAVVVIVASAPSASPSPSLPSTPTASPTPS